MRKIRLSPLTAVDINIFHEYVKRLLQVHPCKNYTDKMTYACLGSLHSRLSGKSIFPHAHKNKLNLPVHEASALVVAAQANIIVAAAESHSIVINHILGEIDQQM